MWFLLALCTAFLESLRDVFNKKAALAEDAYAIVWSLSFFTAIFLLPLALTTGIPVLGNRFWWTLLADSALNALAYVLFIKALAITELSKVAPLTTLTPLFLLITAPVMVGEFPNAMGLVGVLAIVLGAYLLNLRESRQGWFEPFRGLVQEHGPRLAIAVAFIWSLTSTLDKIGIQNSAPIFWVFAVYLSISIVLLPTILLLSRSVLPQRGPVWKAFMPIGLFNAAAVACQMTALSLTLIAYVIAIKRMSAVFGVIFGWVIFRERRLKTRLLGAIIMVVGVGAIALSQAFK